MPSQPPKLVKQVSNPLFDISLMEAANGFYIEYEWGYKTHKSEIMKDFNMVSFMFDLKLQELEGN